MSCLLHCILQEGKQSRDDSKIAKIQIWKHLKIHASIKILLKICNIRNCLHYNIEHKEYFTQWSISMQYHLNHVLIKISWKHCDDW